MLELISGWAKKKAIENVLKPIDSMVDENINDISTTIGSFIIRSVRGKFQRSITFTVGMNTSGDWMEEALYGIIYEYNDIKTKSKLELDNDRRSEIGSGLYYRLDDGTHNLKYRKWNILLFIQSKWQQATVGRSKYLRQYTIISYDLSPEFVTAFERDMIRNRNSILKIKSSSNVVEVYRDGHESDGYTYFMRANSIPKRRLSSIYLPYETKKVIVDTINEWVSSKSFYHEHGIPWNLKILLFGSPGVGKDSLIRVIATEWNRNIIMCSGGKNGQFIPNCITDWNPFPLAPLYVISDIDKYPSLINEPDVDIKSAEGGEEKALIQKQIFGNMINALDGISSGEGKIIIMTTNHIEKFSDTFLRSGRIDLCLEIPSVQPQVFRKYMYDFYKIELPENIELVSDKISVSDLQKDAVFMKMSAEDMLKKYVK